MPTHATILSSSNSMQKNYFSSWLELCKLVSDNWEIIYLWFYYRIPCKNLGGCSLEYLEYYYGY